MSATVDAKSWELLTKILSDATDALNARNTELIQKNLSAFGKGVTQLGLKDMRELAVQFARFYSQSVLPSWDEEAVATLIFSLGALVEKMQMFPYGEKFSSGLREIHEFLDVLQEEPQGVSSPAPPEAPGPPSAPPTSAPAATAGLDTTPVRGEPHAVDPVMASGALQDVGQPALSSQESVHVPPAPVESLSGEPAMASHPDSPPCSIPVVLEPAVRTSTAVAHEEEPSPAFDAIYAGVETESETSFFQPMEADAAFPGPPERQVELCARLLRLDPCSRVFVQLAEALCAREKWCEAAEVCRRGLKGHPYSIRARFLLGWALMEMGCVDESEFVLQKGRADLERNADIYRLLADISRRKGDLQRAAGLMEIHEALKGVERPALVSAATVPDTPGEMPESSGVKEMGDILSALLKRLERESSPETPSPRIFDGDARGKLRELLASAAN